MAIVFRLLLVLALAPSLWGGASRVRETGIPFIRNFKPREYGADAQNWAVIQDPRGIVYVGNNLGVLEFDGVRWRLLSTPKGGAVRSLALGSDGKVYVGAVGEFGVLTPDATGQMAFSPLSSNLEICPRFTDVWVAASTPRGMFFQSREALFLLQDGRVHEWKATTTFHTSFAVGGRIFVRERDLGLLELRGDKLAPVKGGETFKGESIFAMASLEGEGGPGGILVASRNQGLFRLTENGLAPYPTPADSFLKRNALYNGTRLPDGTLALATLRGGVLMLSSSGRPLGVLDRSLGLMSDNIKQIFPGHGPSLWLALDTGIAQVEWPSPFTSFDERMGVAGQVWDVVRHRGTLYAATGQGIFALSEAAAPLPHAEFRPIPGLSTQCCSFLSTDGDLLVGSGQGIYAVRQGKAVPIRPSSYTAIAFLASRTTPGRVFAGLQGQLVTLRRDPAAPSGWVDEGAIPGLRADYYTLEEEADGTLWLGTGTDHVVRVRFPPGWKGGADQGIKVDTFGAAQGLEGASIPWVASIQGSLAVATHAGVYHFREDLGRFEPHPLFKGLFPEGARWVRSMKEDGRGRIWMATTDEVRRLDHNGFARENGAGGLVWEGRPFQRLADSVVQVIYPEPEGVVWLGGPGGVKRFDPSALPVAGAQPFNALVRKVLLGQKPIFGAEVAQASTPRLAFRDGALRFEFSAPAPGPSGGVSFQVHLDGYDGPWSPWSTEAQKEYTSLPEGRYVFRLRARDAQGNLSADATYPFVVLAPRYRAWWAWLLYALALGLSIWAYLSARTRRLRQRNTFLHARITEATWELRDREKRLEVQASDLERMNGELRTLNRHKDQLMGIVVHDLRNPLSGLLLAMELLAEEDDLDVVHQKARQALKVGEDMRNLIVHFLDISAIDAGRIRADLETLDGNVAAQEASMHFSATARAKGLILENVLPDPTLKVLADRRFLKETLDNLLSNALKFSPAGSRVILRLERAGNKVRFSVEDQGPGLEPEDHERLFKRFARLSARPTGGEPSVGLGLSIVKHLVEAMGGSIRVESEPGNGAAFRVELPAAD